MAARGENLSKPTIEKQIINLILEKITHLGYLDSQKALCQPGHDVFLLAKSPGARVGSFNRLTLQKKNKKPQIEGKTEFGGNVWNTFHEAVVCIGKNNTIGSENFNPISSDATLDF